MHSTKGIFSAVICKLNEMILIFRFMSYVNESLILSSDTDSTSSVNDKSFDYFLNKHFISLDPKHDSR